MVQTNGGVQRICHCVPAVIHINMFKSYDYGLRNTKEITTDVTNAASSSLADIGPSGEAHRSFGQIGVIILAMKQP